MSARQTMSLGDTLLQLLFRFIVNTLYGAYLPSFLRWFWWSSTSALSAECVQCLIWLFSVVPELDGFPVCCPPYSLNHFQMVPVAPIITGITVVFTFHILRWISTVRSLYFKIFPAFFFDYITVCWDGSIYQYACPLFIISDYNIWLIIIIIIIRGDEHISE